MTVLLIIIHVLICLFMIVVVLLQSGQAGDLASAFGGMGSQTAFGPRGSETLLSKATWVAAALFLVTSLSLAIIATRGAGTSTGSILEKVKPAQTQTVPAPAKSAAPVAPAPAPAQKAPASGNKK